MSVCPVAIQMRTPLAIGINARPAGSRHQLGRRKRGDFQPSAIGQFDEDSGHVERCRCRRRFRCQNSRRKGRAGSNRQRLFPPFVDQAGRNLELAGDICNDRTRCKSCC
jgi:hypothetical protein